MYFVQVVVFLPLDISSTDLQKKTIFKEKKKHKQKPLNFVSENKYISNSEIESKKRETFYNNLRK